MKFRNFANIFLPCEVFNTSVDKCVENGGFSKANYTLLSTLNRFAPFQCNNFLRKSFFAKVFRSQRAGSKFSPKNRDSDSITKSQAANVDATLTMHKLQYHFGGRSR